MRKIIALMVCGLLAFASCTEYDEVAMWNKNEDTNSRLAALEELCHQLNTNLNSLKVIVEGLQQNDYVTGVVPVIKGGETVGYTITFSKSGPVTIYHGKDGATPVIGVKQDTDNLYYWTKDGEWLTDSQGNKILAQGAEGKSAYELAVENGYHGTEEMWLESLNGHDGKSAYELAVENGYQGSETEWLADLKGEPGQAGTTPQLEIQSDGYWYISYDNGQSWQKLGKATGEPGQPGDSMFSDIDATGDEYIILTLAGSGEQIRLPYYKDKFDMQFVSGTDKVKAITVFCGADSSVEVSYELTNPANVPVIIEYITHSEYKVTVDTAAGKITITAPTGADMPAECDILILASDDERTIMRKLTVRQLTYITYTATQELSLEDSYGGMRFDGKDLKFLDEQSTFDPVSGVGKWAYTGTVTEVAPGAFNGDSEIRTLILPEGVEFIGDNAFHYSSLESIQLPESLKEIDQYAFSQCKLTEITFPANLEYLRSSAFQGSSSGSTLEKVIFTGDKLKTIEFSAFQDCSSLKVVELPTGLETIERQVFMRCSSLETITIPDNVITIGTAAFSQCDGMTEAIIGNGVVEIGDRAFAECTALKNVVIGRSIQSIGDQAFNTKSSRDKMTLEKVTVLFDNIDSGQFPVLEASSRGVFPKPGGWDPVTYKIYVPQGTAAAYRSHWSDYSSLITEIQ